MSPQELRVSPSTRAPKGYGFLRKGNVYMTGLCRRKTLAARRTLYVVVKKNTIMGLRAPASIIKEVYAEELATRERRRAAVEKRDGATLDEFTDAIRSWFPYAPEEDVAMIAKQSLQKRCGRVGRTNTMDLERKVKLAVRAHIRHRYTQYESLLKAKMSRENARKQATSAVMSLQRQWIGGKDVKTSRVAALGEPREDAMRTNDLPVGADQKVKKSGKEQELREEQGEEEEPRPRPRKETGPIRKRYRRCSSRAAIRRKQ